MKKSGNITNTITYDYDSANQLTEFTDNDYIEKYTYDSVGNMLEKNVNGQATLYTFNEANQLITETLQEKTIEYIYNQNGDLTEKATGEKYGYGIQGNLTSIVGNGIDKQYTYNGNGKRLSETTDGETIFYVNDLNRRYEEVLQTYDEDGKVINTYIYGVERISSQGRVDETYLYDGRGSVAGTVNQEDIVTLYAYTAYGDLMPSSPMPNVFGFNGEQTDYSTGLQYLRARYYDITINRFFQEDDYRGEYSTPNTLNRYIYTASNPVMYVDPSGYYLLKSIQQRILVDGKKRIAHSGEGSSSSAELSRSIEEQVYSLESKIDEINRVMDGYIEQRKDAYRKYLSYNFAANNYRFSQHETMVERSEYYKDRWQSAKEGIKACRDAIKDLEEYIARLWDDYEQDAREAVDERIENYPANNDKNYIVDVYGSDISDPYGISKILLSNVSSNVIAPYLRLLFTKESTALINSYYEQDLTKEEALDLYYQEQDQRNDLVNLVIGIVGTGGNSIGILLELAGEVFSVMTSDKLDEESTGIITNIIIDKIQNMDSYGMTNSVKSGLRDYIIERTLNEFLNHLDYLRVQYDEVKGGTYITTRMMISTPTDDDGNIRRVMISGRFNLIDNGYVYDSNELLNYVTLSTLG